MNVYLIQYQTMNKNRDNQWESRQLIDSRRDSESIKQRFSLNMPDCSAVLENNINNNLMDTNQMSWLQPFAEESEHINNSNILEEEADKRLKNVMKFSFNQNYPEPLQKSREKQQKHKQRLKINKENNNIQKRQYSKNRQFRKDNQNILSEITNSENQKNMPVRSQAGSIKRNKKISKGECYVAMFQCQRREVIQNISLDKIQEMTEKLDFIINKGNQISQTVCLDSQRDKFKKTIEDKLNQIQFSARKQSQKHQRYNSNIKKVHLIDEGKGNDNNKNKSINKQSINKQALSSNQIKNKAVTYNWNQALELIFNRLDRNKIGKLSKDNCFIQNIKEQFKFIFGNVLTRIKLKKLVCNKKQFLLLCNNTIEQLQSEEVANLLKQIKEEQSDHILDVLTPLKDEQVKINKSQPKFNCIKQQQLSQYHSQRRRKSVYDIDTQFQSQNNQSRVNVPSNLNKSNTKTQLFTKISNDYPKCKLSFDQQTSFGIYQSNFNKLSKSKKQNAIFQNSSKKSSVCQSTIRQQRKGLQDLMRLNQKMQNYLSNKKMIDKITNKSSQSFKMNESSLRFSELIKHI